MSLSSLLLGLAAKLVPSQPEPERRISTADDVIWERRRLEALKREARELGIEIDLQRAGQHT